MRAWTAASPRSVDARKMGANRMVCVVEVGLKREDNQALGREFGCFSAGIRGLIGRRRKVARIEGTPNGGYGSLSFNRF